jgi:uridine phosphorylase
MELQKFLDDYDVFRDGEGCSYHIKAKRGQLSGYVLTCGSPERVRLAGDYLRDVEVVSDNRGLLVLNGLYGEEDVSITAFNSGMGPSSAEISLTEVIFNIDLRRYRRPTIVRAGTAGSWHRGVEVNDVVIERGVIRDDGASNKIAPLECPAATDDLTTLVLIETAGRVGLEDRIWIGKTICKSTLYVDERPENRSALAQELRLRQRSFEEMGAVATSMESAPMALQIDFYNEKFREHSLPTRIGYGCALLIVSPHYASAEKVEFRVDEDSERNLVHLCLEALRRKNLLDRRNLELRGDISPLDGAVIERLLYRRII